jgi:hypothetical protein
MITPGPWVVGYWSGSCNKVHPDRVGHPGPRGDDPCEYEYKLTNSEDFMGGIAGPKPQQMVVGTCYDSLEISRDDARLIAAAPDMAQALWDITLGGGHVPLTEISRIRILLAKAGYVPPQVNPDSKHGG